MRKTFDAVLLNCMCSGFPNTAQGLLNYKGSQLYITGAAESLDSKSFFFLNCQNVLIFPIVQYMYLKSVNMLNKYVTVIFPNVRVSQYHLIQKMERNIIKAFMQYIL